MHIHVLPPRSRNRDWHWGRVVTGWSRGSFAGFAIVLTVVAGSDAQTPQLTRGPYLQALTTSNVVVRWRTSEAALSRVQFGWSSTALDWVVQTAFATNEHIVTLTNLAPNTRYFYAVGTGDANLAGGVDHYFVTAPVQPKPVRIWVIGCSGSANQPGYEGQAAAVRDAYYGYAGARDTEVWLALGDNAYMKGEESDYQADLFDIYPALLRRCALWPAIGNHDVGVSGGEFPQLRIFSPPTAGQAGGVASGTVRYYSFNYGDIHLVCLDSQTSDRSPGSAMLTWLEQDLAANTNTWLMAYWHGPPYSFGSHSSDNWFDNGFGAQMRQDVVPILEAHGVDLVLCAHSHNYERSFLLDGHYGNSSTLTANMIKDAGSGQPGDTGAYRKEGMGPTPHQGAVYVVCGSSGWLNGNHGTTRHPAMFTRLAELGSMVIDVDSNRLDAVFLQETGAIRDQFTILKGVAPEELRIATSQISGGQLKLQWKSVAERSYRVEHSASLEPPAWQPVSPDILATGATTGWTNAVPVAASRAFYRVAETD